MSPGASNALCIGSASKSTFTRSKPLYGQQNEPVGTKFSTEKKTDISASDDSPSVQVSDESLDYSMLTVKLACKNIVGRGRVDNNTKILQVMGVPWRKHSER